MHRNLLKNSFLVIAVLLVAACGAATQRVVLEPTGIVWPGPPDAPKIEFLGEFSRSADLGIQPSFWGRLVSLATGSAREALERPMAVVASEDGQLIFVADPGIPCVHRYDLLRGRYDRLKVEGAMGLDSPVGLALTPGGRLFVSDSKLGKIFQLPPGARDMEPFATQVSLKQPTGLAWSAERGRLYVSDTGEHSVKVLDGNGRLILEFGGRGSELGELNFPTFLGIAPGGDILVTDSLNFRIQRFTPDGRFLSSFGQAGESAGTMSRPKGVALDSRGHIYLADGLHHALQVFGPAGELMLAMGRRGHAPGEFWLPAGVFMGGEDRFYVADSYNKRVQVFRYLGGDL